MTDSESKRNDHSVITEGEGAMARSVQVKWPLCDEWRCNSTTRPQRVAETGARNRRLPTSAGITAFSGNWFSSTLSVDCVNVAAKSGRAQRETVNKMCFFFFCSLFLMLFCWKCVGGEKWHTWQWVRGEINCCIFRWLATLLDAFPQTHSPVLVCDIIVVNCF